MLSAAAAAEVMSGSRIGKSDVPQTRLIANGDVLRVAAVSDYGGAVAILPLHEHVEPFDVAVPSERLTKVLSSLPADATLGLATEEGALVLSVEGGTARIPRYAPEAIPEDVPPTPETPAAELEIEAPVLYTAMRNCVGPTSSGDGGASQMHRSMHLEVTDGRLELMSMHRYAAAYRVALPRERAATGRSSVIVDTTLAVKTAGQMSGVVRIVLDGEAVWLVSESLHAYIHGLRAKLPVAEMSVLLQREDEGVKIAATEFADEMSRVIAAAGDEARVTLTAEQGQIRFAAVTQDVGSYVGVLACSDGAATLVGGAGYLHRIAASFRGEEITISAGADSGPVILRGQSGAAMVAQIRAKTDESPREPKAA